MAPGEDYCKTTRVFTDNENINISVNKTRIRQNNKLIRIHIATSVPSSISSSKVDDGKRQTINGERQTSKTVISGFKSNLLYDFDFD